MKSVDTQVFLPDIFWAFLKKPQPPKGNSLAYLQNYAEILDNIDQERISKEKNFSSSSRYTWKEKYGNTSEKVLVPPELKEIFSENSSYLSGGKLQYEEKVFLSSLMLLFRYTHQSKSNVSCNIVKYRDNYPDFVTLNAKILAQGLDTREPPELVGKTLTEFLEDCNDLSNFPAPAPPTPARAPVPPTPAPGNARAITLDDAINRLQDGTLRHKNLSFKINDMQVKSTCKTFWDSKANKIILCKGLQNILAGIAVTTNNSPAGTSGEQVTKLNTIEQVKASNITFSLKN